MRVARNHPVRFAPGVLARPSPYPATAWAHTRVLAITLRIVC
jgi:hypothetical protein